MKNINFISPVPPAKKKEIRRWFIVSALLMCALFLYISISLATHLYLYYALSSQTNRHDVASQHCTNLIQKHKEKEQFYNTQLARRAKIEQYLSHPKNPYSLLDSIIQQLAKNGLQQCSITSDSIEFSYINNTIQLAQKQFERLPKIPGLHDAQLVSLQHNNNSIISTVRAKQHKKKSRN